MEAHLFIFELLGANLLHLRVRGDWPHRVVHALSFADDLHVGLGIGGIGYRCTSAHAPVLKSSSCCPMTQSVPASDC